METFKSKKGTGARVKGSTIIDHRVQANLGITLFEYVLVDFIATNEHEQIADKLLDTKGIVITQAEFEIALEQLAEQNILALNGNRYITGPEWNKHFDMESDFDNEDPNDPGFWQIMKRRGNKPKGRIAYMNARKVVSKEELHEAAKRYVATKDDPTYIMHVSSYCNPKYQHWKDEIVKPKSHGSTSEKINELARNVVSRNQITDDDDF